MIMMMMMMRVLCFLFTLLPFLTKAQVSMSDFLGASLNEPGLQSFTLQDNFLSTRPFRLAPFQKLEFRTESNQLDPKRQDYALRLNLANPWETIRSNQYFETYQKLLQMDRNRLLKQVLQVRYEVIIGWIHYHEIRSLKEEDKQTTEKMLAIMEAQRFSTSFDADNYVKLKLDQIEKTIELEEVHFEIENQGRKVAALYEQAGLSIIEWQTTALISLEKLEAVVDSLSQEQVTGGEVAYRENKVDLATRAWQLEKSNISMGFLQTQYQNYRIEQGREPWNLSLGFTIPVFNPNKNDMAKRRLNIIEAEGDLFKAKDEQQAGRELYYQKIKSLIVRHRDINTMMQELNLGTLGHALQQINNSNPIGVIRLHGNLIKLKTMASRLKQEIYLSYIRFLGYSEVIQQLPLVNYLSPDRHAFTTH